MKKAIFLIIALIVLNSLFVLASENYVSLNDEFYVGENQCKHLFKFQNVNEESNFVSLKDMLTLEVTEVVYNTGNQNENGYLINLRMDGFTYKLRYNDNTDLLYLEDISESCPIETQLEEAYEGEYASKGSEFIVGAFGCRQYYEFKNVDENSNFITIEEKFKSIEGSNKVTVSTGDTTQLAYSTSNVNANGYLINFHKDGYTHKLRYNEITDLLYLEKVIETCEFNSNQIQYAHQFTVGSGECQHTFQFYLFDHGMNKISLKDLSSNDITELAYGTSNANYNGVPINLHLDGITYNLRYSEVNELIYLEDVDKACSITPGEGYKNKGDTFYVGENNCKHQIKFEDVNEASNFVSLKDFKTGDTLELAYSTSNSNSNGYLINLHLDGLTYKLRYSESTNLLYLEDVDETCPIVDECSKDSDCDDNLFCTIDECSGTPKKCSHTQKSNCNKGNYISIGDDFTIGEKYCEHQFEFKNTDETKNSVILRDIFTNEDTELAYSTSESNSNGYLINLHLDGLTYKLRYSESTNLLYLEDVDETCPSNEKFKKKGDSFIVGEGYCQHDMNFEDVDETKDAVRLRDITKNNLIELSYNKEDVSSSGYLLNLHLDGLTYKLRYNEMTNYLYLAETSLACPIQDDCNSNIDCDDKNACTKDTCSGSPKKCSNEIVSSGCDLNGNCVPIGTRTENKYCDVDNSLKDQKLNEGQCNNNYECKSNLCVNDNCIEPHFIQKIINWFRNLFGMS